MRAEAGATVLGAERLARVLDQNEAVPVAELAERVELARVAEDVDGDDALRPGRERGLDRRGIELPLEDDVDHVRSWFVYVVKLAREVDRERVIAALEQQGVASSRYLPSIHLQAYMRERYGFREGLCPVSEDLSRRTLALPFYTAISPEDQERVAEALAAAVG